jgi:Cys-tRNA(Pro)/Cys-tRNA(Cys) deacylase
MKKLFPTVINDTAQLFDTVCVSAGKVGFQVQLNPEALIEWTGGKYADVTE